MDKICITGVGIVCEGVAHLFAENGFKVVIWNPEDKAENDTARSLERLVSSSRRSISKPQDILSRITITSEMGEVFDAGIVIDLSDNDMGMKKRCFRKLDSACLPDTIFTSNTSAFLIDELAGATTRQHRVAGLHFFKPLAAMKHAEVLRGMETSDKTLDKVMDMVRRIGKKPVEVAEVPGFLISRLPIPTIKEAGAFW